MARLWSSSSIRNRFRVAWINSFGRDSFAKDLFAKFLPVKHIHRIPFKGFDDSSDILQTLESRVCEWHPVCWQSCIIQVVWHLYEVEGVIEPLDRWLNQQCHSKSLCSLWESQLGRIRDSFEIQANSLLIKWAIDPKALESARDLLVKNRVDIANCY